MTNRIGKIFQVSIFGESHNEIMGVVISGIAPGIKIDHTFIKNNLARRRPKLSSESSRVEQDDFEIVSGYFEGYTTGTPLTILIYNHDVQSFDYKTIKNIYRPSHADYPASVKYLGFEDYRGGGHFSGRLTAPLVIAGSVALQILKTKNVIIKTHIKKVANFSDTNFEESQILKQLKVIEANKLDVIDQNFQQEIIELINKTKSNNDSLGAILESIVLNVEAGLGEPFFMKLDSLIAAYIMSIPSIKGVSFGKGFNFVNSLGSEVADEYYYDDKVKTKTNNNGGILGGLSTGMPIIINSVVKPASSINKNLKTITKDSQKEVTIKIKGRHDSSIFTRIPIIVDSLLALAVIDMYCIRYGYMWQRGENNV